jgi:hypothetical protein
MVYHARMGRKPEWVSENLTWLYEKLNITDHRNIKVWPIVQAHDDPYEISAGEFDQVLKFGLQDPATGVMMFTSRSVAESRDKMDIVKKNYLVN